MSGDRATRQSREMKDPLHFGDSITLFAETMFAFLHGSLDEKIIIQSLEARRGNMDSKASVDFRNTLSEHCPA